MTRPLLRTAIGCIIGTAFACSASATTLVALTSTNQLLTFDSASPGSVTTSSFVLPPFFGNRLLSIDYNAFDGSTYGLTSDGLLIGLYPAQGTWFVLTGGLVPKTGNDTSYEIEWNQSAGTPYSLRIVGAAKAPNTNIVWTGLTFVQTSLSIAGSKLVPNVIGAAFLHNVPGGDPNTQRLYYIDSVTDALYVNTNAYDGGVLTKVAQLNLGGYSFGFTGPIGFDIAPDGHAFVASGRNLFGLNLDTGTLQPLGTIGANVSIMGLTAISAVPEVGTGALLFAGLGTLAMLARRRRGA